MDEFKILLKAIVDAKDTQAQLDAIKNLSVKIKKLNLDQSAITELRNQLSKNGIDINLVLGNTSQIQNQAKQTGQQIGKLVSDSAEKAITGVSSKGIGRYFRIDPSTSREFENEMKHLVSQWTNAKGEMTDLKIDTRTVYDKKANASFERLHQATVTYKNDLDEVTKKTIAWRQVGTTTDTKGNEVTIHGFVEVAGQYSKALEKASIASDTFADKQTRLKASLSNSLNSIKSSVADQKSSKPIKDQTNISSLQSQYQIVEQAIANVGSASKSNFAQMEADARTQISALNDLVRQYRNTEYLANSTKDFPIQKDIQIHNLQAFKNKIEGSNVPIAKLEEDLSNLDAALNNVFDTESLTSYLNQMDDVQSKFKKLSTEITAANRNEKVGINVSGLESKITDIQRISPEINNFKTQINGAEVSVESLLADLSRVNSQGDFSIVNAKFKSFADSANVAGIAVTELAAYAKKIDEIQLSIDNGHGVSSYQNQINGLINDFQRYGVSAKEAETITSNLQTTFNAMKNMSGQELVNQADKFEQEFKSVKVSIDHAKLAYDKLMQPASKEKVTTTLIKVQNLLSNNTRVTKKVRQEWELYVARLSSGSDIAEKELNDIKIRLRETESQMRNMGKLGLSFGDSVKRGMGSFTQWVSATSIVMGAANTVRKMISEVKELDNAQVELAKVSDLSAKGLADVTKEAYELGETVAKTGTQVLDAVTEFKRSGYDMTESMDFAEQALTMVNVAEGIDQASDAATALISIMKGYGDSSSDFAQKILDATNQVSNTQSITFDDLIDGSQRLAAVASQAGLSYEQMLGTLTGANEVLQNIEKTASGQITIFTRLQGIQLPDEEDVLPVAKLQEKINTSTKGIVNVVDQSTGQLRNAYDVLDDINEIWDTLDKNTQEGIAFAAGGRECAA